MKTFFGSIFIEKEKLQEAGVKYPIKLEYYKIINEDEFINKNNAKYGIKVVKTEYIENNTKTEESIFVGELSLDGSVEKINGVLPICIEAKKLGIKRIILSRKNSKEAAIVDGLEILPVDNLKQLMEYLKGEKYIEKERHKEINDKNSELYEFDFSDVKGQENVKRALEISAAGGHNCILIRKSRCWKNNVSKTISKYITRYKF